MIAAVILAMLWLLPGHTWTNTWDNGHARTLYLFDNDAYEKPTRVEFSGAGSASIDGKGVMSMTGNAPRYRILERFENVNVSMYAKRVDEEKELPYQGFVIGARSQHYTDATCGANTYYASLTYDGRVSFEKELFHGTGQNAFYPNIHDNGAQKYVFKDGVPVDKWIGIRFIVKTVPDGALLQLYLDKDNTGQWDKVLEFTDDGTWKANSGGAICEGYYPTDRVITDPGFVFVRNDGLGEADYRNLTITELAQ